MKKEKNAYKLYQARIQGGASMAAAPWGMNRKKKERKGKERKGKERKKEQKKERKTKYKQRKKQNMDK